MADKRAEEVDWFGAILEQVPDIEAQPFPIRLLPRVVPLKERDDVLIASVEDVPDGFWLSLHGKINLRLWSLNLRRLTTQSAVLTKHLLHRRHRLPAELCEKPDGGLLHKLVLGVGVGHDLYFDSDV
jgi:hypothetical protein